MEPSLPADSDDSIADGTSSKKICRGIKDESSSDPSLTMIVGEGAENQDASSLPMIVSSGDVSTKEDPERLICLSHGSLSIIGRGRAMEDAVTVAANQFAAYDFFAVYDGQGGCRVSQACRDRMHHLLAVEMEGRESGGSGEEGVDWEKVMVACFSKMNDEVNRGEAEEVAAPVQSVGSTAAVVLVAKEEVVVANCGNSRTVLCRDGVAVPLSRDQHGSLLWTKTGSKVRVSCILKEVTAYLTFGKPSGEAH